jgi:hypothetical protein
MAEEGGMLVLVSAVSTLTDFDPLVFAALVPQDHYLRQVSAVIDFERFLALPRCAPRCAAGERGGARRGKTAGTKPRDEQSRLTGGDSTRTTSAERLPWRHPRPAA